MLQESTYGAPDVVDAARPHVDPSAVVVVGVHRASNHVICNALPKRPSTPCPAFAGTPCQPPGGARTAGAALTRRSNMPADGSSSAG